MAAGETEKDVSPWTVDSTRESLREVFELRDRIDMWRDRLYEERQQHQVALAAMQIKMDEQRFTASQEAAAQLAKASDEKFAGFPEQYARLGETNAKFVTIEQAIASLVTQSTTRTGQEAGVATQRTEVAAQREQRRLSTGTLVAAGALAFTLINTLLPWLLNR